METAYQSRTERVEEMGFQDYFNAIGIYTPISRREKLPRKLEEKPEVSSALPTPVAQPADGPLLLIQVLAIRQPVWRHRPSPRGAVLRLQ